MKTYVVDLFLERDGARLDDQTVHDNRENYLSYMNSIHKIYSGMGYTIKHLVRTSKDLNIVNYYISYVYKER